MTAFNKFLLLAVLPASLLLSACSSGTRPGIKKSAMAGDEVVDVEGMAPYNASDVPGSRAAALAQAQRNALEMVVGVYVTAKTRVDKAVAIENNILANVQ